MFKNESQSVTNKKFRRYVKNKASGNARELDKHGNPIKMMELENVSSSHERHKSIVEPLYFKTDHKLATILFEDAHKGEIDFSPHEKIVLVEALQCTVAYLYKAICYSSNVDQLMVFIETQNLDISADKLRDELRELHAILTHKWRTFWFFDRRRRCEFARAKYLEARSNGMGNLREDGRTDEYCFWDEHTIWDKDDTDWRVCRGIGIPRRKLKWASYDKYRDLDTFSQFEYVVSLGSYPVYYGVEVDDNLLHFGTSRRDRAIEMFKQLAVKISSSDKSLVHLFEHIIKSDNNYLEHNMASIYGMEDVYEEL